MGAIIGASASRIIGEKIPARPRDERGLGEEKIYIKAFIVYIHIYIYKICMYIYLFLYIFIYVYIYIFL